MIIEGEAPKYVEDDIDPAKVTDLQELGRIALQNTRGINAIHRERMARREKGLPDKDLSAAMEVRQKRSGRLIRRRQELQKQELEKRVKQVQENYNPDEISRRKDRVVESLAELLPMIQTAKKTANDQGERRLGAKLRGFEEVVLQSLSSFSKLPRISEQSTLEDLE